MPLGMVFSVQIITDDTIREYIKRHREHQGHNDDDFPVECAPNFSPFETDFSPRFSVDFSRNGDFQLLPRLWTFTVHRG